MKLLNERPGRLHELTIAAFLFCSDLRVVPDPVLHCVPDISFQMSVWSFCRHSGEVIVDMTSQ